MDRKRRFDSWFHGWLPKEPLLKNHSTTSQIKPKIKTELEPKLTKKLITAISITNPPLLPAFSWLQAMFLMSG
jgi:hypothetical protein